MKIIQMLDDEKKAKRQQELKTLVSLHHQNVVHLADFGFHERYTPPLKEGTTHLTTPST